MFIRRERAGTIGSRIWESLTQKGLIMEAFSFSSYTVSKSLSLVPSDHSNPHHAVFLIWDFAVCTVYKDNANVHYVH